MQPLIAAVAVFAVLASTLLAAENPYRDAAFETARWIRASAIRDDQNLAWPADPRDPKSVSNTLYAVRGQSPRSGEMTA